MRLFVAIDLPAEVGERIARLVAHVRDRAAVRWSSLVDLHVTTKFIGEWPEERLGEVAAALGAIAHAPFDVAVRGVGWFPSGHAPRVLWVGVHSPDLAALAAKTERALVPLGVDVEARRYTPHVTLARIARKTRVDDLRDELARLGEVDFGAYRVDSFALYESKSGYHERARFALRGLEDPPLTTR